MILFLQHNLTFKDYMNDNNYLILCICFMVCPALGALLTSKIYKNNFIQKAKADKFYAFFVYFLMILFGIITFYWDKI